MYCISSSLLRYKNLIFSTITSPFLHYTKCNIQTTILIRTFFMEKLKFDNSALRCLPVDSEEKNYCRTVRGACFSRVKPTPLKNPELVSYSKDALDLIGVDPDKENHAMFVEYFSGNKILPGSEPAAHCYCGHQFGYFSGQLGDGATMYLGEIINNAGERWELQFKGAGKTPYSRSADGRKVLRSSIREYLCSEAMHYLGIPTTRAGTCVTSDTRVDRDIFYNGNTIQERATVITRIAQTFLRFGSFEIFKTRDSFTAREGSSLGREDIKTQLLDYCIKNYYPDIYNQNITLQEKACAFLKEIVNRTALLVAKWQAVGFCHGVLNTDNMSIIGLTIDYGPFGFMDRFKKDFICNGSDDGGRYSYHKQPEICEWNLHKLVEMLDPILPLDVGKKVVNDHFMKEYEDYYLTLMRSKLGLVKSLQEDKDLIDSLLDTMEKTSSDFTNTFRCFNSISIPGCNNAISEDAALCLLLEQCSTVDELRKISAPKLDERQLQMMVQLLQQMPQLANQKMVDQVMRELDNLKSGKLLSEFTEEKKREQDSKVWSSWISSYSKRLAAELSSDGDAEQTNISRLELMSKHNPVIILRNYIAQIAIERAEKGDFSGVNSLLERLKRPYDAIPPSNIKNPENLESNLSIAGAEASSDLVRSKTNEDNLTCKPPSWALELCVT